MQRTSFDEMACSIAVVGEPWSPLVIRDVFVGIIRFDDLLADLGICRRVLSDRLRTLIENEILQ